MNGPCVPWSVEFCCPINGATPAATGQVVEAATEILWGLSGRQFGFCDGWIRPCKATCFGSPVPGWPWWDDGGSWVRPALIDGEWTNVVCGVCNDDCSCSQVEQVILPGLVNDVLAVYVDGVALGEGAYRLDNQRILVRTDGESWPLCQDRNVSTGPGTWFVNIQLGREVPAAGELAASELATELLLSCMGSDECKLPQRVTSIERNGLAIALDDVQSLLREGQTGLTKCDYFLATFNPNRLRSRSRVYSPDVPQSRWNLTAPPEAGP